MTSTQQSKIGRYGNMSRHFRPILTSEPSLEPTEPIDYKALSRRRDQMQEYTYEQSRYDNEMYQEEINTWRMYDELDNSLLELEGK